MCRGFGYTNTELMCRGFGYTSTELMCRGFGYTSTELAGRGFGYTSYELAGRGFGYTSTELAGRGFRYTCTLKTKFLKIKIHPKTAVLYVIHVYKSNHTSQLMRNIRTSYFLSISEQICSPT